MHSFQEPISKTTPRRLACPCARHRWWRQLRWALSFLLLGSAAEAKAQAVTAATETRAVVAPRGSPLELRIIDRPILFNEERIQLTLDYIRQHYGLQVSSIEIVPRVVVVHWTGTSQLEGIWQAFNRVQMRAARRYLRRGGRVNVSAHFLVDRDGTIFRLMPETWMARHCIGLNYDAIGIENIGDGRRFPLTDRQLKANAALIRYLSARHPIRVVIGHHEWRRLEHSPFFRERNPTYRNAKDDPGAAFMRRLRREITDLKLADSCDPGVCQASAGR